MGGLAKGGLLALGAGAYFGSKAVGKAAKAGGKMLETGAKTLLNEHAPVGSFYNVGRTASMPSMYGY